MGFPLPDSGSVTEDQGLVGGFLTASGDAELGPFWNPAGGWTAETIAGAYGGELVIDANGVWTYTADNSNASIQALNSGETLTEVFTVSGGFGTTSITITINGADEPPCFVAGTLIDTPAGPRRVEDLRPGDMVLTRDDGAQVLQWAGQRDIAVAPGQEAALRPIRLCKDSLAPGLPEADILLSPLHRVLLSGPDVQLLTGAEEVLCPVGHLLNGQTIRQEPVNTVRYHHLLFDAHQVVRSSGCDSESFFPGHVGLNGFEDRTRDEVFAIFPELRSLPDSYGKPARHVTRKFEAELLASRLQPPAPAPEPAPAPALGRALRRVA